MKRLMLPALLATLVLGTGLPIELPAAASSRSSDYMQGPGPMTAEQRGLFARDFVNKWGVYYQATYRQPVAGWAQKEALIIAKADPENLRRAMGKTTLEAAMMVLRGQQTTDDEAIDFLARQPMSNADNLPQAFVNLTKDLVYTPLDPCRILDTRALNGPILSGSTRSFDVYPEGSKTGFEYQGGKANTKCGMIPDAAAVAVNIATPLPEVGGYLTVFPHGTSKPFASNLDYAANELKNNEIIAKIGTGAYDISVYAHGKTHVVADIVGYYAAPLSTYLDCVTIKNSTSVSAHGKSVTAYCPTGYSVTGGAAHYGRSPTPGSFSTRRSNDAWQADATSNPDSPPQTLNVEARCCRVPGR